MDIETLKASTSIVEIITDYLGPPVRKQGRYVFWNCPFHADKTPSLGVTDDNGRFTCFGCNENGDVIDFVQKYLNVDFATACEKLSGGLDPIDRVRIAEQRAKQAEHALEATIKRAQTALEELRSAQRWLQYHAQMDRAARDYWRKRGIPDVWQDIWQLGWNYKMKIGIAGGSHDTQTATIPLFDETESVVNIKHRLITPPLGAGKYRYEVSGLSAPLFLASPEAGISENIILVEGEIKAMVLYITLDDRKACVIGMPGLGTSANELNRLEKAQRITLVTDPGSRAEAWRLVKILGRKRCRVLIPPLKIDDGILTAGLGKNDVKQMLNSAVPA